MYEEKGLKIFAITVDGPETVAKVRPFLNRYKYTFPVLLDIESKVIALYNPRVIMPYTILIDKQGKISYVHQGYSPGDEIGLEEKVVELLEAEVTEKGKAVSFSLNEAFLYRNFSDRDYVDQIREGKRSQIMNRLDLSMTAGKFLAGARLDANLDFTPWDNEYSIAKRFVEFRNKNCTH